MEQLLHAAECACTKTSGMMTLLGQVGAGSFMTRILMISEIVPWPTVKAAFLIDP